MIRVYPYSHTVPEYIAEHVDCVATFTALVTLVFRFRGDVWIIPFLGFYAFTLHTYPFQVPTAKVIPTDDSWVNTNFLLLDRFL